MSCSCGSRRLVCSLWLFIWWIYSYGSSKRTEFYFWQWQRIVSGEGPVFLDAHLFLLNSFGLDPYLWLFWISCSMVAFACMYNGTLKGKCSSVPSCCMWISLTPLLLIPHPRNFSFRYGIEDVLCLWKDLGQYYWLYFGWPVFLCWYCYLWVIWWYFWMEFQLVCWSWFGPFWLWNVFPKFLLTIG